jgi:hypothetical protein
MRIAICLPQVPFVRGGAEIVAGTLAEAVSWLEGHCEVARELGRAGKALGERVCEDAMFARLLS